MLLPSGAERGSVQSSTNQLKSADVRYPHTELELFTVQQLAAVNGLVHSQPCLRHLLFLFLFIVAAFYLSLLLFAAVRNF
jgi:hypothetical protein